MAQRKFKVKETDKIPLQRTNASGSLLNNIEQVLLSGWWTEGEWTKRFEDKVCDYIGAKHAIAVPNATVGMEMVVRYLAKMSIVTCVLPAYTHPATAFAIINGGGQFPIFCDIDRKTGLIDVDALLSLYDGYFRSPPRIMIPVSLFGNPVVDNNIKNSFDGMIIEDAACSLGSINADGDFVGYSGTAVFSFHPRKIISTGEGGMIVTDNESLASFCREYKNFGGSDCTQVGTNYKLTDILGAVGVSQMDDLGWILEQRRRLAERYNKGLRPLVDEGKIRFLETTGEPNYQSYVIDVVGDRDHVRRQFDAAGIETQVGSHYLPGLPYFKKFRVDERKFPEAEYANSHYLTLPLYPSMFEGNQDRVIEVMGEVLK